MRGRYNRPGVLRLTANQSRRQTVSTIEALAGRAIPDLRQYVTPAPQPRAKATHPEHDAQVAVIKWWYLKCAIYGAPPIALMAIPNAGKRGVIEAAWLKAEGLRPGALDLMLAVPVKPYSGLWIEMKIKPNKPTEEQCAMIAFLRDFGYAAQVCWSAEDAIATIERYLSAIIGE